MKASHVVPRTPSADVRAVVDGDAGAVLPGVLIVLVTIVSVDPTGVPVIAAEHPGTTHDASTAAADNNRVHLTWLT